MDLFLTALSAITTALIALLPFLGDVTKMTSKGNKEFTKIGSLVVAITVVGITAIVLQKRFNDIENEKKEKRNKASFDSTLLAVTKQNTSIITNNLGKYGYRFDSVQNLLVKIQNHPTVISETTNNTSLAGADPLLSLCNGDGVSLSEQRGNVYKFYVKFCSRGASSAIIKLPCHYVLEDSLGTLSYRFEADILAEGSTIANEEWARTGVTFNLKNPNAGIKYLYMYVKGSYSSIDKAKVFPIDLLYCFDLSNNESGVIIDKYSKAKVFNFLRYVNAIK
ncbi:hypothetical protein JYG30_10835 [Fibrella sp. USSR17]